MGVNDEIDYEKLIEQVKRTILVMEQDCSKEISENGFFHTIYGMYKRALIVLETRGDLIRIKSKGWEREYYDYYWDEDRPVLNEFRKTDWLVAKVRTNISLPLLLDGLLEKESGIYDVPTSDDWQKLERKFDYQFPPEFVAFIELMSVYQFPGGILNVATGVTNGNDMIDFTYDYEMKLGLWNRHMIPFYEIGNGDYFCLSSQAYPNQGVYYWDHETSFASKDADDFNTWLKKLPKFLNGDET